MHVSAGLLSSGMGSGRNRKRRMMCVRAAQAKLSKETEESNASGVGTPAHVKIGPELDAPCDTQANQGGRGGSRARDLKRNSSLGSDSSHGAELAEYSHSIKLMKD